MAAHWYDGIRPDDLLWHESQLVEIHPAMVKGLEKLIAGTSHTEVEAFVAAFELLKKYGTSPSQLNRVVSRALSQKKPTAFICHAKEDAEIALTIYAQLRRRRIEPWIDERNLAPGVEWDDAIQKAIQETDVILVLLSDRSVSKKGYVQKEIRRALEVSELMPEGQVYVIPIRLDQAPLPQRLSKWQAIKYGDKEFYKSLTGAIESATSGITKP